MNVYFFWLMNIKKTIVKRPLTLQQYCKNLFGELFKSPQALEIIEGHEKLDMVPHHKEDIIEMIEKNEHYVEDEDLFVVYCRNKYCNEVLGEYSDEPDEEDIIETCEDCKEKLIGNCEICDEQVFADNVVHCPTCDYFTCEDCNEMCDSCSMSCDRCEIRYNINDLICLSSNSGRIMKYFCEDCV